MSGIYSAVGRLGRNAETRYTQSGKAVANLAIAVDVGFGDNKSTMWLDASIWGKRAEGGLIQYLTKGQQVWVAGELGTREFQRNNGQSGFAVTLNVSEIDLVGSAPQGGQQQGGQNPYGGQPPQQQAPMDGHPPQGGGFGYQQQQAQHAQQQGQPPAGGFDDFDQEIPFN